MKKKISIIDSVILNSGDAAILLSMLQSINSISPDSDIEVFVSHFEKAKSIYGDLNLSPTIETSASRSNNRIVNAAIRKTFFLRAVLSIAGHRLVKRWILLMSEEKKALNKLAGSDVVVSCGGGFLNNNYSVLNRAACYLLLMRLKKPLFFYAQSIGPFKTSFQEKLLAYIFKNSLFLTVREKGTFEFLTNKLKLTNVALTADEAFTFKEITNNGLHEAGNINFCFCLRPWKFSRENEENQLIYEGIFAKYAGMVSYILTKHENSSVTFLSTCQGVDGYIDDSKMHQKVIDKIAPELRPRIELTNKFNKPDEIHMFLKKINILITMRMHMSILGFLNSVPAIGIPYESKTNDLFNRMGMDDYLVNIVEDEVESIYRKIDSMVSGREQLSLRIFNACRQMKEQADLNREHLRSHALQL